MYYVKISDSVRDEWYSCADKAYAENYASLLDGTVYEDAKECIQDEIIAKAVALYQDKKRRHIIV